MRKNKSYITMGLALALAPLFVFTAHADESDQMTTITFTAPVQIPGEVLPAATYMFKLADSDSARNLVQIFNAEGTILYATLETIPTERQQSADRTTITLGEEGSGTPDALLKWFYPGRLTGNEFLYPRVQEKQLAREMQYTIVANPRATHSEARAGE